MIKLIRITTVPISLHKLLHGQLKHMHQYFNLLGISSGGETLEKVKEEQGIDVFPLEMSRTISPIKDLVSLWEMYRLLKKEQALIVHTHTPKAGIVGMLAAKLAGVPIRMHTVAGLPLMEASGVKRTILNFVEKLTYACATKVYPNSFGLKDFIEAEGFCEPVKIKVIGKGSSNGINTQEFSKSNFSASNLNTLKTNLGILETDTVFCFVGRIVGDKGINELIHAFAKISKDNRNVKLLLVGDYEKELDPIKQKTEQEINRNPQIVSVGWQTDVRPYLAISDVFVFPSYREGFPNVVMQAGAMELPCIVSDINGCNEIIEEGVNGIIIPAKSEAVLFKAMEGMLNPTIRNKLSVAARKIIIARYEQQYVWGELLKEYNSLIKEL